MPMTPGAGITGADVDPYPHRRKIERDGDALTYVLVTDTEPRQWAIVQRHVSGWVCLATGKFTPTFPEDSLTATFDMVTRNYGDGSALIPLDDYGLIGDTATIIHIRRDTPARIGAYCGISITRPYDPNAPHTYKSYMQHCTGCTTTYRAENFGRCPIEA